MGLLSKASAITKPKALAFSEFILKYSIQTYAIFEQHSNHYYIKNSIGFDGSSIISSLSTKDFWDGICPKNDTEYIFSKENNNTSSIIQFFSFKIRDDIDSISVYKHENNIHVLCNKKSNDFLIRDMLLIDYSLSYINLDCFNKNITKDTKVFLYEIDFEEATEVYFSLKNKTEDCKNMFSKSICNELMNRFACYFAKYATQKISDSSIHTLMILDKSILEEHLISHLVFTLHDVIESAADLISFNSKGIANSFIELKNFIQVD